LIVASLRTVPPSGYRNCERRPNWIRTLVETCLFLVLPLPIYRVDGRLHLDTQACNGLRLWLQNFDRVLLCNPLLETPSPPPGTSPLIDTVGSTKLEIHPLPAAWTPLRFIRTLPEAVRKIVALIDRATDLQFAIGGLWGDWGALAALIAARRGRKAAVWTDRVESEVMRLQAERMSGARRLYRLANAALARRFEAYVIRRSAMGLFHGMDTYSAYAPLNPSAHLVHDIHLGPEARIGEAELEAKLARSADHPLRIVYAGRAHPDKGVRDWIETLKKLAARGVAFSATWYGDGPEYEAARLLVAEIGLASCTAFPGATQNRPQLMAALREADIFLFCHKTPESPRCLIEALLAGTPIVGYDSAYPRDLIARHGGGLLTPGSPAALADAVAEVAGNPGRRRLLIEAAALDGHPMVDEDVFRQRSDLIKSLRETNEVACH
jgi:colanic acid/amylovoran biosynthesis glycosyltransferase